MNEYAIFMDIDGTLVDHHQHITPKTKAAIQTLGKKGQHFFIATGRMLDAARAIAAQLGPDVGVIASNGAVIQTATGVKCKHLGIDALTATYQAAAKHKISTFYFTPERVYYTDQLPDYFSADANHRVAGTNQPKYERVADLKDLLTHEAEIVNGIMISDDDSAGLAKVSAFLGTCPNLDISTSAPNNIELLPLGVTKATAIRAICKDLEIPITHTMAFGDGENDLAMLKTVNIGVAMANAVPKVAKSVKNHTDSNLNDGIATFLTHYFD